MSESRAMPRRQQTVKLAIDCSTGDLISSESLLTLDEADFADMRRSAMAARVERKRGGNAVRFRCALCNQPLYLSRYVQGHTNRWFTHDGPSENCPWYEKNRLAPEQVKALIYLGQQEGRRHRELKNFLVHWLGKDSQAKEINQERTTVSQVLKGEWRRPDVRCLYQGKPLVFEIQLSYTFLSDVIARDAFYKREGIFIVWVFADFDKTRAVVIDEAFFNHRNLFVLDAAAVEQTIAQGILTFSGVRQEPKLVGDEIRDDWVAKPITLADTYFPRETMRPYFYDYEGALRKLRETQRAEERERQQRIWMALVRDYLGIAVQYYDSDYSDEIKEKLLAKVDEMYERGHWHRGFEALRANGFMGYHGTLPSLLSIKLGRPVGYRVKTAFQVMEAGVRTGHQGVGQHAFAVLFLWAYKVFKPNMSGKHRDWIRQYAHNVRQSIDSGEATYRRFTGYDEAASLLFPDLEESLSTDYGTTP